MTQSDDRIIAINPDRGSLISFAASSLGAALTNLALRNPETGAVAEYMGEWPSSTGGMTSGFVMGPVVGTVSENGKVIYNGKEYEPGKHGYARKTSFVSSARENGVSFEHIHDPQTAPEIFPFAHKISVDYAVNSNVLAARVAVENLSDAEMPFGCGLHPAFKWPLPGYSAKEGHFLRLLNALPEGTVVYRPRDGKIYKNERSDSPFGDTGMWKLAEKDFERDAYFFIFPEKSRGSSPLSLEYGAKDNPASMVVGMEGWDGFGIWGKPGAANQFLCIEPLKGVAFADGANVPSLKDIDGLARLPAGKHYIGSMNISFGGKGSGG